MHTNDSEEMLKSLHSQVSQIHIKLNHLALRLTENDDWVYDDVADRFDDLSAEFDTFSANVKNLPASAEIYQMKADLGEAFKQLNQLRTSAFAHIPKPKKDSIAEEMDLPFAETTDEPERDAQDASEPEMPESEEPLLKTLVEEDTPIPRKHRSRIVRKPSQVYIYQTEQEQTQRQRDLVLQEEQRRTDETARLDRIQQENEILLTYRQRQYDTEHFERLQSHNDLSKVPAAEQASVHQISEGSENIPMSGEYDKSFLNLEAATAPIPDSQSEIRERNAQSTVLNSNNFSEGVPVGHPQQFHRSEMPNPAEWSDDKLRSEAAKWFQQQRLDQQSTKNTIQQPSAGGSSAAFSQGVPVGHLQNQPPRPGQTPHVPNIAEWNDKQLAHEAEKWRTQQLRLHPDLNPEQLPDPKQWCPDRLRAEAGHWLKAQANLNTINKDGKGLLPDPSQWPIEKLRTAANRWWLEQNIQSEGDAGKPTIRRFGPTKAQLVVEQSAQEPHRYQLNGIGHRIAGITHMVYLRSVQEILNKSESENDTLRGLSSGSYYISTATAAAGLLMSHKPTAELVHASNHITGTQLSENMRQVFRDKKRLTQDIKLLQQELAMTSSIPAQESLTHLIAGKKEQLNAFSGELSMASAAHRLLHEQKLDQEVLNHLMIDGKLVTKGPNLQELGRRFLQEEYADLRRRYGHLVGYTDKEILSEIDRMKANGAGLKRRVRTLRSKGLLSDAEQAELQSLQEQLQRIGKNVGRRIGLLQKRKDLNYQERRIMRISQAISKHHQQRMSLAMFMRSTALRPMYSEQTEGTARMIQLSTDRRTIHAVRVLGKVPVQVTQKVTRHVAPEFSNRLRYTVDGKKQLVHQVASQMNHAVKSSITSAIPRSIRTTAHAVRAKQDAVKSTITGIKTWGANTRAGQWLTIRKAQSQTLIRKTAEGLRAISIKLVAGLTIMLFLVGILTAILNLSVSNAVGGGVIASPATPTGSGKINLSPYSGILRDETNKFQAKVDDIASQLESILESNGTYNGDHLLGFTTKHSGPYNNDCEILAMMAVRFNQSLDLASHPEIETYLRYMHQKSHHVQQKTEGHKIYHSQSQISAGECPYPKYRPKPHTDPPSPSVSPSVPTEPEMEAYCPGHVNVTITVDVAGLDDLFALDDGGYTSIPGWPTEDPNLPEEEKWSGWTEENIARVNLILSLPWIELYDGFSPGSSTVIGNVISGADEYAIWQALKNLTGGNEFGAAGLMGNLYAESGLSSTNLQDSYESSLGYSDDSYTLAVDSGAYTNFVNDSAGYGLAQWTFYMRKQQLLDFAQSQGASIGDLSMQLNFLANELSGSSILEVLKNADSVSTASDEVLVNFEKPADQSQAVKNLRTSYGQYFYNKYVNGIAAEGNLTQAQRNVIQVATNSDAYGIPAEKGMCQAWAATIYEVAGLPVDHSPSALASGRRYGVSEDFNIIPPGAAVYGYASNPYGHVGIYVGNGLVYHNIGGVAVDTLDDWLRKYNGFCWGWQAGTDLTQQP